MKTLLTISIFLFCPLLSRSQIIFENLKENDKTKDKAEKAVKKAPKPLFGKDKKLLEFRQQQLVKDTSFYNYIFSQGNKASFFANRESKENVLLSLGKYYEDESIDRVDLEVYELVFDLNRLAEFSIYIDPDVAMDNFSKALKLMTGNEYADILSMEEVLKYEEMVDTDTMNIAEKYAFGKTLVNISILLHAEGRIRKAQDLMAQCLEYFEKHIGKGSAVFGSLYNNLAVLEQSQGKFLDAERNFEKSESNITYQRRKNSLDDAIIGNNRALLFNELGQHDEAQEIMDHTLNMAKVELRESGRDNIGFLINKGLILYSAGQFEEAIGIFENVLELKRKRMAKNQTDYANVENYLASALMQVNQKEQIPTLLNDALRIFRKKYSETHPAYLKTKHKLGKYYLNIANYNEARSHIEEVNKSYLKYFGANHPDYLNSIEDLAVIAWKTGDQDLAKNQFKTCIASNLSLIENLFGGMSEYEKGKYWAKTRPLILKFYNYAVERAMEDPTLLTEMFNLQIRTKGILFGTSLQLRKQILNGDDENLKEKYQRWLESKEALLAYYTFSKTQLTRLGINLSLEESKVNRLEKELNSLSEGFSSVNKLPSATFSEVKESLKEGEAAIEIIAYPIFTNQFTKEKNYAVLISKPGSEHPILVLLNNGNDLDGKYAKAYFNTIKLKVSNTIIYDKFWAPIQKELNDINKVYLSPDGVYFQINIGALPADEDKYVSDQLAVNLLSSTKELITRNQPDLQIKNAVFYGFPDYGNQNLIDPLPGTKTEIENIKSITESKGIRSEVFMSTQATELNIKNVSSPQLLHIATHGFFTKENDLQNENIFGIDVAQALENPLLRSGLFFANAENSIDNTLERRESNAFDNGILTAYEALTLDLHGTSLVVLSACETGLGEIKSGEGVYGLQRALQIAGAETIVMSLWKVNDEATQLLMTNFYQYLMNGNNKDQAFRQAQLELRNTYSEPYYWGAFVMLN